MEYIQGAVSPVRFLHWLSLFNQIVDFFVHFDRKIAKLSEHARGNARTYSTLSTSGYERCDKMTYGLNFLDMPETLEKCIPIEARKCVTFL